MARIMDQAIQGVLAAGTRVLFADNVANRAAIGAANTLGAIDLIRAQASLAQANAKPYGEFYVAVMHPAVVSDLRRELGANSITEVTKYTTAPLKGEIGSIYGIRIVESSNIQTFASTVTVYPTYVFGRNAYGVVDFQALQTSYKPLGSGGTDDPLDQRATAAVKVNFASVILQPLAMLRIESATSGDLI
jgi:N4-gp56 family major capsid protein